MDSLSVKDMLFRRTADTGLPSLVEHTGRDHMTVVEVGSYAGESAHLFLDTGKVDRIYCVDPWVDGYDSDSWASRNTSVAERLFDASFAGDSRVVKVKSTLQQAIASRSLPRHVDLVYVDGCHKYDCVVADLMSARGMCDFLAGHDSWHKGVRQALADVFGRPPDASFSDSSWIFRQESASRSSPDLQEVVRRRFDRILCLTCPQGVNTRLPAVMREFEALGLGDFVLPYLNVHNVFAHMEMDRRRYANDGARKVNVKNCMLGHYGALKFARDAGYSSVMILEDDCRFVRPLSLVANYLECLPECGNATLYSGNVSRELWDATFPSATSWQRWGKIPAGTFLDFAVCYTLGRAGIECLVDYYESCGTDGYRWPIDAADRIWPHLTQSMDVFMPRAGLVLHGSLPSIIGGKEV